jgi:hypothetical protein
MFKWADIYPAWVIRNTYKIWPEMKIRRCTPHPGTDAKAIG